MLSSNSIRQSFLKGETQIPTDEAFQASVHHYADVFLRSERIAQIVAGVFPGLSRSGTTIFVAMVLGTSNRAAATEFAFLVGIPTMYAASAFEIFGELRSGAGSENWTSLGVAFAVSTVTAFVAVKWLLGFIRSHRFTAFAIYRLLFGGLLLGLSALGMLT